MRPSVILLPSTTSNAGRRFACLLIENMYAENTSAASAIAGAATRDAITVARYMSFHAFHFYGIDAGKYIWRVQINLYTT
ncbi:hypothetical protein KCP76_19910 [Salmonella enterica subsp. enterica serovar Weltevreden]|nr:hypothetical protein KCP76_19910 [Salmonella enterica subsp. enterica serovar Weltevreden]